MAHAAIALALVSTLSGVVPAAASAPVAGVTGPGPLRQRAYVILPFENITEEASLDWISGGLALVLGETLRGWGARAMDPDERSVFLEANGFPAGSSLTLASVLELGRKMRHRPGSLRPDRIVIGRFDVADGTIRITTRALDLETEKARPWKTSSGRLRDLLDLQREVALAITASEGVASPRTGDAGRPTDNPPLLAFETYCRAMGETDSRQRLQLLRRAAEEHPDYPEAIYQAAALLARAERWSDSAETLARLKTPPRAYEAGTFILTAILALQQRDHQRAAEAARRALALDDSARAHLLLARALAALGDEAGAAAALNHAQTADPADPEIEETRRALGIGPS